jgi:hypothetical protein
MYILVECRDSYWSLQVYIRLSYCQYKTVMWQEQCSGSILNEEQDGEWVQGYQTMATGREPCMFIHLLWIWKTYTCPTHCNFQCLWSHTQSTIFLCKAIPTPASTGLRAPGGWSSQNFQTIGTQRWQGVNPTHQLPLAPMRCSRIMFPIKWLHFNTDQTAMKEVQLIKLYSNGNTTQHVTEVIYVSLKTIN